MCYNEHIDKSMMTIIGPIRLPIHSWPRALPFGNLRPQGKVLYKTLCYFQMFYLTANVNIIYTENFLRCTHSFPQYFSFPILFGPMRWLVIMLNPLPDTNVSNLQLLDILINGVVLPLEWNTWCGIAFQSY